MAVVCLVWAGAIPVVQAVDVHLWVCSCINSCERQVLHVRLRGSLWRLGQRPRLRFLSLIISEAPKIRPMKCRIVEDGALQTLRFQVPASSNSFVVKPSISGLTKDGLSVSFTPSASAGRKLWWSWGSLLSLLMGTWEALAMSWLQQKLTIPLWLWPTSRWTVFF